VRQRGIIRQSPIIVSEHRLVRRRFLSVSRETRCKARIRRSYPVASSGTSCVITRVRDPPHYGETNSDREIPLAGLYPFFKHPSAHSSHVQLVAGIHLRPAFYFSPSRRCTTAPTVEPPRFIRSSLLRLDFNKHCGFLSPQAVSPLFGILDRVPFLERLGKL